MLFSFIALVLICVAQCADEHGSVEAVAPPKFSDADYEAYGQAGEYIPTEANLAARKRFRDYAFGMFIHWGVYSLFGRGEWIMHHEHISIADYEMHAREFNPVLFNATEWVRIAKRAGYRYICITTKHHDGFAMWGTLQTDWNIVDWTEFKRDVIKELAAACHKEKMPLFLYHSHLDWHHPEYNFETGWTGHNTGRALGGNFEVYLEYLDAQLTELLTNYGEIAGIWFDGIWDKPKAPWGLLQTYSLIHSLQPSAMVGNNHHLVPFAGEDMQLWEKDLPGENKEGYSPNAKVSLSLPLETCDTLHADKSWGYTVNHTPKPLKDLLHMLIRDAGYNANLLLNIGPMYTGEIQPEFQDRLEEMGDWLATYGDSIYCTRAGPVPPQPWGVSTRRKGGYIFLHVLEYDRKTLKLPGLGEPNFIWKEMKLYSSVSKPDIHFKTAEDGSLLLRMPDKMDEIDTIIMMRLQPQQPMRK